MRFPFHHLAVLAACVGMGLAAVPQPPRVHANDNRTPAGIRRGDTALVELDVVIGRWYPEADDGPSVDVAVFAVRGEPPQVPGPLIRVPAGTTLDVQVRNTLADSAVTLHGFVSHPSAGDSVRLAPGAVRRLQFNVGTPGTYLYWATLGSRYFTFQGARDSLENEQLAGAFVVDSAGARPNDRVFVLNIWGEPQAANETGDVRRDALTINGKAWPYTERLSYAVGDSVRWRVINASLRFHPMHLHGFYFRVDAKGNGLRDSTVPPAARPLVVTEELRPRETGLLTWSPTRPGNWLFHCHIAFHAVPERARLTAPTPGHHDAHMAGLVLGLSVRPPDGWTEPERPPPKRLVLTIEEIRPRGRSPRAIGVAIVGPQANRAARRSRGSRVPGPPLFLTRGEPTNVTVFNWLQEPTAIHWHGLELESRSDGVAGWSGRDPELAPAIAPNDTFTARLSQPRAGTFIYHTHLNDISQLTAGLYGPIVVLEPGQVFDPARDHLFVVGWDGPQLPPRIVVNGDSTPPPLELAAGVAHRLRFVNIGPAQRLRFAVLQDSTVVTWRPLAADGATLPPARSVAGPAVTMLAVGMTFDAELTAPLAGEYRLVVGPPLPGARPLVTQRLLVR